MIIAALVGTELWELGQDEPSKRRETTQTLTLLLCLSSISPPLCVFGSMHLQVQVVIHHSMIT